MTSEVKRLFEGKWKSYKSENIQNFLEQTGTPENVRENMMKDDNIVDISVNGDTINISGNYGSTAYSNDFQLGKEYQVKSANVAQGITTFADGKMTTVLTPIDASKPQMTMCRTIVNDEMVQTVEVGGVMATRYFKKS